MLFLKIYSGVKWDGLPGERSELTGAVSQAYEKSRETVMITTMELNGCSKGHWHIERRKQMAEGD